MSNFWTKLQKPIYALAPMAGVTDSAWRQICKQFGADVVYSEMASAAALVYNPEKTLEMLYFKKGERPFVVQIFGADPDHFKIAAALITKKIKPDGLDINFGCPVKKIQKQGAGAVLMNKPELAREIIKSVIDSTNLPVSIKVRSRVDRVDVLKFLAKVSDLDVKAVMIHGRTLAQGFGGPVDWEIIKKARDYFGGLVIANGGVNSAKDARELLAKTRADGVGIARGALGNPWIFSEIKQNKNRPKEAGMISKIVLKHARLAKTMKREAGIIEMRKHLCWYAQGLPGARKLRAELVKVKDFNDIKEALKILLKK